MGEVLAKLMELMEIYPDINLLRSVLVIWVTCSTEYLACENGYQKQSEFSGVWDGRHVASRAGRAAA